ncbi:MAG TPA: hypothetical protein VLK37_03685 [Solirubrobacterales bacterium]|nr:hypothetical protein [Solirubrobacterales bacterium]
MIEPPRHLRTPSVRISVLAVFLSSLILAIGVATPAAAAPSKFVQELCDSALPGGGVPEYSFSANPGAPFAPFQNCASPGGSMGIAQVGQTSATFSSMSIAIPPTTGGFVEDETISGISSGLSPGNHFSHIKVEGWPTFNGGESQRTFFLRSKPAATIYDQNGGGFAIVMTCDGNVGPCNGGTLAAHDIAVTQVDPNPPVLKGVAGSLLAPEVLRGHHEIGTEASDKGGGLSKLEVLVNGLPAGSPTTGSCNVANVKNPSYEGTVAVSATPCPWKLTASWQLDTAAYPFQNGANSVQVCASDFSTLTEAQRTCSSPQTVTVDNSCSESAVPGGESLTAHFTRSHKDEVVLPFGRAGKVAGELTNNAGDAISGATVCVQMHTQGSRGGLEPVATATTDAHGHFTYKVAPGPNRRVFLGYRHDSFQIGRSVRFFSRAKIKFKITPGRVSNGSEIKMRGKLPGPRAGGRVAIVEAAALHSEKWYPFGEGTTNRNGIFHIRYRFDDTSLTTIYKIRASAPRQHAWPWEGGRSKPVLVEVRGS